MAKGAPAYDLSLFETKEPRLETVHSPEKVAMMQAKKARQEKIKKTVSNLLIVGLFVAVLSFAIVNRIELTELNDEISQRQEELSILQSETSRMTNELSSKTSAESVDAYAKEHGMKKIESHQIEYITVDAGDKIEVSDPSGQGLFESIGAMIAGWFGG